MIALCVVGLVFFIWYPTPLATAVGVTQIFLMMLAIDVTVGPILGFIVYKEGKKTLKMDLTVIILLQLSALGYGIYSIEQGRPVWLVYTVDRFELVRKNEIIDENIEKALAQYQHPSWFKPQYVGGEFAKDAKTRNDDMFAEALNGISLAQKPERYVALSKVVPQIKTHAESLDILKNFNDGKKLQSILAKYPQANAFVPLKAGHVDMTVLLDKNTGEVIKIVDLRPWR